MGVYHNHNPGAFGEMRHEKVWFNKEILPRQRITKPELLQEPEFYGKHNGKHVDVNVGETFSPEKWWQIEGMYFV